MTRILIEVRILEQVDTIAGRLDSGLAREGKTAREEQAQGRRQRPKTRERFSLVAINAHITLKIRQNAGKFRELINNLRLKPEKNQMTSFCRLLVLSWLLVAGAAHSEEIFPQPPELQPDVDFWVSIFTTYTTDEGVLHDNRDIAVVYDRLNMPASLSRSERNRRVDKRRKELQVVLRSLASGKRDNLSTEEARVLAR